MKKVYPTLAVAAMLMAAHPAEAKIQFGIRGGANLINFKTSGEAIAKDNRSGFYVGPTVKFTLPLTGLGIDASAVYDYKEVKVEEEKIKQQAIAIPINVRYGVGLGSLANIFAFTGPQFAFNIGDKRNIIQDIGDWTLKSSQFSWNVGIGLTLLNHLEVKGNYNIAISKTGEANVWNGVSKAVSGKTNSWQVGLAYYF